MVRYLKRLKSSKFVRVKAFPMYGGMGVSAPSLHRESTDSLILCDIYRKRDHVLQKVIFSYGLQRHLWKTLLSCVFLLIYEHGQHH